MSTFVESATAANQAVLTGLTGAAALAKNQSASFNGETVVHLANPQELLADAAEELTFGHSEHAETKLTKRKIAEASRLKTFAAEQAEKYLAQVPDLERQQKLDEFTQSILGKKDGGGGGSSGHSKEDLLEAARGFSDDVSHQFLALEYLQGEAARTDAPEAMLDAIDAAMGELEAREGPAIVAGLNVSATAQEFASPETGDLAPFRGLYRDVVLDYGGINDAYAKIMEQNPTGNFADSVEFVLKGLGADLGGSQTSLSPVRLKAVLDDMDKLKSLATMFEGCGDLLGRVQRKYDDSAQEVQPKALMTELLGAQTKGWQGGAFLADLPDKLHITSGEPEIYFLQGFKELVRSMPTKVFDGDLAKRERLMQAVQEAVDTAIDNEWDDE